MVFSGRLDFLEVVMSISFGLPGWASGTNPEQERARIENSRRYEELQKKLARDAELKKQTECPICESRRVELKKRKKRKYKCHSCGGTWFCRV